jgi:hypothetical protein
VATTPNLFRNGAVGFIDWLDGLRGRREGAAREVLEGKYGSSVMEEPSNHSSEETNNRANDVTTSDGTLQSFGRNHDTLGSAIASKSITIHHLTRKR